MERIAKFLLLCFSCALLTVSCRDTDVEKDLNSREDGNREINTTELNSDDNRSSADSLDTENQNSVGEDIYRENDIEQNNPDNNR